MWRQSFTALSLLASCGLVQAECSSSLWALRSAAVTLVISACTGSISFLAETLKWFLFPEDPQSLHQHLFLHIPCILGKDFLVWPSKWTVNPEGILRSHQGTQSLLGGSWGSVSTPTVLEAGELCLSPERVFPHDRWSSSYSYWEVSLT